MGRHVIAGQDHFHGNAVVAALVELDEMVRADVSEVEKSGGQQEKKRVPGAGGAVRQKA